MRVKILAEDARTADYYNIKDCPLVRALKRAGFQDVGAGGNECRIGDRWFSFTSDSRQRGAWNSEVMRELADSKKSFRWLTLTEVK